MNPCVPETRGCFAPRAIGFNASGVAQGEKFEVFSFKFLAMRSGALASLVTSAATVWKLGSDDWELPIEGRVPPPGVAHGPAA